MNSVLTIAARALRITQRRLKATDFVTVESGARRRLRSGATCVLVAALVPIAAAAQFGLIPRQSSGLLAALNGESEMAAGGGSLRWSEGPPGGIEVRSPWGLPQVIPLDTQVRRVSYPVEAGWLRVVPSVIYVPDSGARMPGVVSVGLERATAGDPLRATAAVDWSGKPGGSLLLDYRITGRTVALRTDVRPSGVVALPDRRAPGRTVDGVWTERLGTRTTATLTFSSDRLDLDGRELEAESGRMEFRHRATDRWGLLARVTESSYADAAVGEFRRSAVALGTEYEGAGWGLSATVRDESGSASTGSGLGARVSVQGAFYGWSASLFADAQQQATTIELAVLGQPDLPRDLTYVGLAAASPEKALQLVRDRTALVMQHGVAVGDLRLDEFRVLGGLDVKWRDPGSRRTEMGVRLAMDELNGLSGTRRALLGNLYATWRVFGETDLTASYANWSLQQELSDDDNRSLFRLSVRAPL